MSLWLGAGGDAGGDRCRGLWQEDRALIFAEWRKGFEVVLVSSSFRWSVGFEGFRKATMAMVGY